MASQGGEVTTGLYVYHFGYCQILLLLIVTLQLFFSISNSQIKRVKILVVFSYAVIALEGLLVL